MFSAFKTLFEGDRSLLCPYCFDDFKLSVTPFRCDSPPDRCAPEPDEVFGKAWGDPTPRARLLPAKNGPATSCPACRAVTYTRSCPHCHMDLPAQLLKRSSRNLIFSVIGASGTGKTHYLAVLINQIQEYLEGPLGFTMGGVDDYTIKRYREKFYDPLYNGHKPIDFTRAGRGNIDVRRPLLYELMFDRVSGGGDARTVLLAFFDTAGEDMGSESELAAVSRYIYRSDGIILLLDPLQLDHVRAQLEGHVALPRKSAEIDDIVQRTSNLILKGRRLPPGSPMPIPLALTFSKLDAIEDLLDAQAAVLRTPRVDQGYDVSDATEVSRQLKSNLRDWRGAHVLQQVEGRFPVHQLFGVSALGCNPTATDVVPRVVPHRVADPFLWLLHQNKLVKTAPRS